MHLVASVCLFVCLRSPGNKSHYQVKVFVCVSVNSGHKRMIARMRSIGVLIEYCFHLYTTLAFLPARKIYAMIDTLSEKISHTTVYHLILYIGQFLPFHWSVTAVDEAIHHV